MVRDGLCEEGIRRGLEEESFRPGGKLAQRPRVVMGPARGPGVSIMVCR